MCIIKKNTLINLKHHTPQQLQTKALAAAKWKHQAPEFLLD